MESLLKKIKDNQPNFMEIAATSKALHDVKKLLNTANKSMALTEIVESKVCLKSTLEIMTESKTRARPFQINLMNQGHFLTQNEFNIFDHNQKRKYKGNIFVFQKCVVCTEKLSSGKLQFKAYFPNGTSHIECINENKFLLYERNNYKIELSSEANKIQQMLRQVRQVLGSNEENRLSTISNISYGRVLEIKVPIHQLTKELESSLAYCKRSASNDSLNLLSDKDTNTTSSDNRRSNSSAESKSKKFVFQFGGASVLNGCENSQLSIFIIQLNLSLHLITLPLHYFRLKHEIILTSPNQRFKQAQSMVVVDLDPNRTSIMSK